MNFDFKSFAEKVLTDFNKTIEPEQQNFDDWKRQNEEQIIKKKGERKL